jgi:hypothetical protein
MWSYAYMSQFLLKIITRSVWWERLHNGTFIRNNLINLKSNEVI